MDTAQMQLQGSINGDGGQGEREADQMLSSQDVADFMRMSHAFIKRMAQNGKIPMFKCGTRWRIRRSAFVNWIAEQERSNQPREGAA